MIENARTDGGDSGPIGVAVVTVTPKPSIDEDAPGAAIVEAFEDAGHEVATRELIQNDHDNVQAKVSNLIDRRDVDIVVSTGRTGLSPDDVTLEAVRPLVDKELPAFVDVFHRISYEEIGTGVISQRTLGGIADEVPVFCLPGGEGAARLGAEGIIVPEAERLVELTNGEAEE